MDRRTFLGIVAAFGAGRIGSVGEDDVYHNPVFEQVFPDPAVVSADGGSFYAYGTYNDWGRGPDRRLIPIIRSVDLVDWEYAGAAFTSKPDWRDRGNLWAPDVRFLDGRYVLFYSYTYFGDDNPGIGVAVSESPGGPFEDRGALFRSDDVGVPNSIDPCPIVDDGTPYLFWGSHRGIYGTELAADGLSTVGRKFQVAGPNVEAAYVVERDGRYYLFGSRGQCCVGAESDYRVVVGRASDLEGPYVNRAGESIVDAPGTVILHGSEAFAAPGHSSVISDDAGTDWLLYHAYERGRFWVGDTPRRVLLLDRLVWEDGWPTVRGQTPSTAAERPTVDVRGPDDGSVRRREPC